MEEELKLLCTGDIHLGRTPSRAPANADKTACSPRGVWSRTVDCALDHDVDAVIITGDIVDEENEYIEAYGVFEREATRLADAGITTLAVSGNHDWDLTPDMIDDVGLDGVHLLGRDGTWERHTLESPNGTSLHVDGWSFPAKHVTQSPLDNHSLETDTDAPIVGVAHVDLGATESRYAPVSISELRSEGANAWLLGHIHVPGSRVENDPLVLYPGSPQGLDPGETGPHGPWMVTVETGATPSVSARQHPLATLQYDPVSVDVTGITDSTDLPPLISERAREHAETAVEADAVDYLVLDLTLTGRTSAHAEIQDLGKDLLDITHTAAGVEVTVGSVSFDTRPDIDLEELAGGDGPAGHLAELLLSIQEGQLEETHPSLVSEATKTLETAYTADAYRELRREDEEFTRPTEEDAIDQLEQQAQLLLDNLVKQVEGDADA